VTLPTSQGIEESRFAQALSLHEAGRLGEAEERYLSILAIDPGHVPALLHLGALRLQQGRHDDAIRLTREAHARDPWHAETHSNLGTALHMSGCHSEAVDCYEAALAIDPDAAESYYGLGLALHALRRYEEAAACHERALAIDPDYAEASCGLGAALAALNQYPRAAGCFRKSLDIDPEYVEALCGLAEALHAQKCDDEAVGVYAKAVALRPSHPQTVVAFGVALQAAGRHREAIEQFRKAATIMPDFGDARLHLGTALAQIGRIAEAEIAFEDAVATDSANPHYAFALVNARRMHDDDPGLAALRRIENRLDTLGGDERILFHFAFAKALADLSQHDQSFAHLVTANTSKRGTFSYDAAEASAALERMQAIFTAEFIARHRGAGDPSPLPIAIVGIPRSGSTLVEQILASHPGVLGGGERPDLAAAMKTAKLDLAAPDFFAACAVIDRAQLDRLGADYLARLTAAAHAAGCAGAQRITDKMLSNYCFLGLLHLALPNARIIHTRRDPIDTCLSCYSKLFEAEIPYAYDLGELGRHYCGYDALMTHWRRVLPAESMLDVQYEELVADFEPQARRIVAHCGLDWDDACLSFYKTERVVRTASVTQVRQPIYRTSVGRWRPPQDVLLPLLDGLSFDRRAV
jgi:tetratricopeptide (TPR) repeat protein